MHAFVNQLAYALVLLAFAIDAYAESNLSVRVTSTFGRSECKTLMHNPILAGSYAELRVVGVGPDFPEGRQGDGSYRGLDYEIPESLEFEAGSIQDGRWRVDPDLVSRFQIEIWIREGEHYEDSIWRATGIEPINSELYRPYSWDFRFHVPEGRAGDTLFITASWTNGIHSYRSENPATWDNDEDYAYAFTVVAPCSRVDSDRAGATIVIADALGIRQIRAIMLADSLVRRGWVDLAGLQFAALAALRLGMYEKCLDYIDLNFGSNGRTDFFAPERSFEEEAQEYSRQRDIILHKMEGDSLEKKE